MNEKRFFAEDWLMYDTEKSDKGKIYQHITTREAVLLLNELYDENEKLKEANQDLQHKLLAILDFINEKETVTHQEMKDFWNEMVMDNE